MSPLLQDLLKQAEQLSYEERLELIRGLAEGLKKTEAPANGNVRRRL
ncbi:MAG: hypothetical protein ACKO7W_08840 [Elainella sp.]